MEEHKGVCPICGEEFVSTRDRKYCSLECSELGSKLELEDKYRFSEIPTGSSVDYDEKIEGEWIKEDDTLMGIWFGVSEEYINYARENNIKCMRHKYIFEDMRNYSQNLSKDEAGNIVFDCPGEDWEVLGEKAFGFSYWSGGYDNGDFKYVYHMPELAVLNIGDNIMEVDERAFKFTENLKEINVSPDNKYLSSENGVLYNKDKTELIYYPKKNPMEIYHVPQTLKRYRQFTTNWLENLKEVIFSEKAELYANNMFHGCEKLERIYLPQTVHLKNYEENEILDFFGEKRKLTDNEKKYFTARIRDTVRIWNNKFYTRKLDIPAGTEFFEGVENCLFNSLREIYIPSTVKEINCKCLQNMHFLNKIEVSPDNPYFVSVDGVLYTKDMSELIHLPNNRIWENYSLPKGMKTDFSLLERTEKITIDEDDPNYKSVDGIVYSKDLKTLIFLPGEIKTDEWTVPEWVEIIASHSLSRMHRLKHVIIPETVKEICSEAFYENEDVCYDRACYNSLKKVTFLGSDLITHENSFKGLKDVKLPINAAYQWKIDKKYIEYI